MKDHWAEVDAVASRLVIRSSLLPDAQRAELQTQLTELARSLSSFDSSGEIATARDQLVGIGQMARQLRPLAQAFGNAIDAVVQVGISARAWVPSIAGSGSAT
jgi:hypothetical protein